jgi:hypothetical protein
LVGQLTFPISSLTSFKKLIILVKIFMRIMMRPRSRTKFTSGAAP